MQHLTLQSESDKDNRLATFPPRDAVEMALLQLAVFADEDAFGESGVED